MFGTENLMLFVISGFMLNITPGADFFYILGRSVGGWKDGSAAALGISAGCLLHVCGAALGISALIAASATAYRIVKYVGAAYLIFMGIRMLISKAPSEDKAEQVSPASAAAIFWQGFLTNALNPKVALFFLAFLPQFVSADASNKGLTMLFLGALFTFNCTIWNHIVVLTSSGLASRVGKGGVFGRVLNRSFGALFILFGTRLAIDHG